MCNILFFIQENPNAPHIAHMKNRLELVIQISYIYLCSVFDRFFIYNRLRNLGLIFRTRFPLLATSTNKQIPGFCLKNSVVSTRSSVFHCMCKYASDQVPFSLSTPNCWKSSFWYSTLRYNFGYPPSYLCSLKSRFSQISSFPLIHMEMTPFGISLSI